MQSLAVKKTYQTMRSMYYAGALVSLYLIVSLSLFNLDISQQTASAAIEAVAFDDPVLEKRYQGLIAELRCLVCQNQNLADSDASLAKDLRRKTDGKSDQEILDYMRERYGDFVLYRPPFNLGNSLLWIGPFVLLVLAAGAILMRIKRRQEEELLRPAQADDEAERIKIRNLMKNTPELSSKGDESH